jgi:uncharacterized protein DUF4180
VAHALTVSEHSAVRFVEGPPNGQFLQKPDDVNLIIEACAAARTGSALLYASNMTPRFFDLSSGEVGAILQKLRTYGVRVALICPPESVQFSSRFPDLIAEENRLPYFRFFESVEPARDWLTGA